jgi:cell division septation protein DedD
MAGEETGRSNKEKDDRAQDTEITLGTGKLLGIFFALVIVCSVFFTMGYLLGRSTSAGGKTEIVGALPTGGSTAGKPSGAGKNTDANTQSSSANNADNSGTSKNPGPQTTATASPTPAPTRTPDQSNTSSFAGGSYMVQVAAVSKHEDAEILVSALQKKQYPVFIANVPGDPLFHVQVGPFSDPKDAESMRSRLSSDGYNAIVKK